VIKEMNRWFATLILSVAFFGCHRGVNEVVYVFPDNFRGVLIFEGQVADGEVVKATNGVRVFNVPNSGKLKIHGPLPTRAWHSPSARFKSGEIIPIPFANGTGPVSNDVIALRPIGTGGRSVDWYVVGTYNEAAKAHEDMTGIKWRSDL
jgi:hypothetical protein